MPRSVASDRDATFGSKFWRELLRFLITKLPMFCAHHPETDGQTEEANQVVEMFFDVSTTAVVSQGIGLESLHW